MEFFDGPNYSERLMFRSTISPLHFSHDFRSEENWAQCRVYLNRKHDPKADQGGVDRKIRVEWNQNRKISQVDRKITGRQANFASGQEN